MRIINPLRRLKSRRWPLLDGYLSYSILLAIVVYVVIAARSLPVYTDQLRVYLLIIIFAFVIDGVRVLIEWIASMRSLKYYQRGSHAHNPDLTVVVACHNGSSTITTTIRSVKRALPGAKIVVVDDASSDSTARDAFRSGARVLKLAENHGKVGAMHRALVHVKTRYVLIMDDDMTLGRMSLPYDLLDRYDAVAFQVVPKGNSFWSKLQRYEYLKSMEIGKGFHAPSGSVLCVSGAIGFFRTQRLLEQIDRHSGEFSGEDLERTLLIHASVSSKGVTYVSVPVFTEVPQGLRDWYRQRCLGWNPGFLGNAWLLLKLLFARKKSLKLRYDAMYNLINIPLDVLRIIALPVLIRYPQYFVLMYLIYILLDICTYFGVKRKTPAYLLLVSPLYGLASMITRFVGMSVYVYRETIELLRFRMRSIPDAYRISSLPYQAIGYVVSLSLVLMLFWLAIIR